MTERSGFSATQGVKKVRKEIIKSFQGENLGGLYMVESLHNVAKRVKNFLLNCDLVEDVFSSDEELIEFLVREMKKFNPRAERAQDSQFQ